MKFYTGIIEIRTSSARQLVDITEQAQREVSRSGIESGILALYAQGATAALMVQENDDPNIALDVLDCLESVAPPGKWRHDRVDNNGSAHIQAGIVGPSETLPIRRGQLALSTWQNIFFCDFDGPRERRVVVATAMGA